MEKSNDEMMQEVLKALSGHRFNIQDEKVLQQEIHSALIEKKALAVVGFVREFLLSKGNIIDFFFPTNTDPFHGFGIEVKINGSKKSIYKQLERYCGHSTVIGIILVTNKTIGLPSEINGKPAYILNLGKAWL